MRRRFLQAFVWTGLLCACTAHVYAAENTAQPGQEPENTLGPWRIANTLIFACIVGFAAVKYAPGFFNARTSDIEKAIKDATGLKLDADFRYSEADKKLATLSEEVQRMREQYGQELAREHARMKAETEREMAHMHQNVANEVEALRSIGMREVRQRIAQAAIARAEQRLRAGAGATESDSLVRDFIHVVEKGAK